MSDSIESIIRAVEEEERTLLFPTFTNDDALRLGGLLVDLARERSLAVTVDITRGDQQLFHAAMAGTAAHNDVWITRKVRTVREFASSSYLVGLRAQKGGTAFEDAPWIDPLRYAGHGGAFPITVEGVGMVGTVTVSGLPQRDDHALAVEAITTFLATAGSGSDG
ncbi:heme-degrading domain-containing protein [Planctomonas psychrotolerans]|uniref:heme-degrading domain-containing protein n=1 Tax=Planctomonas psychrotolerans TaxID=2528712 RepID=UPI0012393874|nr:heme-degrading domain-containing protein [Planctomonas psychrotolerans]